MMATVQLPGSERFDIQMAVHTATQNSDVSLAQEFQKTYLMYHASMLFQIMVNTKKFKYTKVYKQGLSCAT